MKIMNVGCGNAFSYNNYNLSYLLEENGERFLIDCGTRIPIALHDLEIPLKSIGAFYTSHSHGDHCGGLEEVAFTLYDWQHHPRHYSEGKYAPKLYANKVLMDDLWNYTLRGGLESMEGFDSSLETFFETCPVEPNKPFYWQGWRFDLVQQVHIMTGSVIKNTFGLFVQKEGHKKVFFTTDCQYFQPKQVRVFYQDADYIFQDSEFIGADMTTKTYKFGSGVHANYGELAGWPSANAMILTPEIRSKLWLGHYQDFVGRYIPKREQRFIEKIRAIADVADPVAKSALEATCNDFVDFKSTDSFGNPCDWDVKAKEDGFAGIVRVGMEWEI